MLYDYYPLKSLRDYKNLYDEINAWVELENEEFDFGEGLMRIEGWYGSEDAYYEMDLESLETHFFNPYYVSKWDVDRNHEYWDMDHMNSDSRFFIDKKLHKSHYKKREQKHLDYLFKVNFWSAGWSNWGRDAVTGRSEKREPGYYKKYYAPPRAKYLRKVSNKQVRRYKKGIKNGAMYRRIFDYWWELY